MQISKQVGVVDLDRQRPLLNVILMNLDEAWPLLERAMVVGEELTKEEVGRGLRNGTFKLLSRANSVALVAHCKGYLRIGLASGNMPEMLELEREITDYGKERGDRYIEIIGRAGWERALKDYKRVAVIVRKDL